MVSIGMDASSPDSELRGAFPAAATDERAHVPASVPRRAHERPEPQRAPGMVKMHEPLEPLVMV
jgi:hypothetical protein